MEDSLKPLKHFTNLILTPKAQLLLGASSAALFSLMLYNFYKLYEHKQIELVNSLEQKYDQTLKYEQFDDNFKGLLGVFSNEVEDQIKLQTSQKRKYYMSYGLPNLGNTCYMNSLLQVLAGSPLFMEYANKIWKHINMITTDNDSIITMTLINQLIEMSRGGEDLNPSHLFSLICMESNTINAFEQQDSHELLVYLQERITKVTAQYLRKMTFDQGLASPELLSISTEASISDSPDRLKQKMEQDIISSLQLKDSQHLELQQSSQEFKELVNLEKQSNIIDFNCDLSTNISAILIENIGQIPSLQNSIFEIKPSSYSGGRLLKGILQIKDLSTNKKIGLNPFAGVYLSTIKCLRCGNDQELHRWEVFYDLSVEVKSDIYQSLEQYFQSEQIQDFTCMKCSLRTYISNESAKLRGPANTSTNEYTNEQIEEVLDALRVMLKIPDLDEEMFGKLKFSHFYFQFESGRHLKLNLQVKQFLKIDKIQSTISKKFSVANPPSSIKQNGYQVDVKYRLSGVIEHFGSAFGGHYVSYKKLFPSNDQVKQYHKDKWVLQTNQDLTYYQSEEEVKANGSISLTDALISNITLVKERENSLSIQTAPPNGKTYFLSFNNLSEAIEWRESIIAATHKHKVPLASFPPSGSSTAKKEPSGSSNNLTNVGIQSSTTPNNINNVNSVMNNSNALFNPTTVDRVSLLADRKSHYAQPQNWQKVEEEQFDENELFQDDRNFVEIEEFKRMTIGAHHNMGSTAGGQTRLMGGSMSAMFAQGGSPDQPLRLGKNHRSPTRFTPEGMDQFDNIDQKVESSQKKPIKRRIYQQSKQDYKIEMGQMTQDQQDFLTQIQNLVQSDLSDKTPCQNWETVTVQNGLTIQALNSQSNRINIDKKVLKNQIKLLTLLFGVFYVLRNYIDFQIDYFYLGLILQLINFRNSETFFSIKQKYSMLKARAQVPGDSLSVGEGILKSYKDSHYDSFDFMTVNVREINRDEEKHILTTEETLDLPTDYLARQFIQRRHVKMLTYWCQDQNGYFYVLRKSLPLSGQNDTYLSNVKEAFVCVPIDNNNHGSGLSEKSLVYFFSEFNYGAQGPKVIVNSYFQDQIKLLRMNILSSLTQYQKYLAERLMIETLKSQQQAEIKNVQTKPVIRDDKMNMSELEYSQSRNGSLKKQSITSNNQGEYQQFVDQTGSQAYQQR